MDLSEALTLKAADRYGITFLDMVPSARSFIASMRGHAPEIGTVEIFWGICDLAYQELKLDSRP